MGMPKDSGKWEQWIQNASNKTEQQGLLDVYPNGDKVISRDGWKVIKQMRKDGRLDEIDALLSVVLVSPAVANEYRLNCSLRAREAKRRGDWGGVYRHLEAYTRYVGQVREACLKTANQDPPSHSDKDQAMLEEARRNIGVDPVETIQSIGFVVDTRRDNMPTFDEIAEEARRQRRKNLELE
jgi:hypothetical protein